MAGIELDELLLFGRQFGLALSGAAALWGGVIFWKASREGKRKDRCIVLEWISARLLYPLFFGGALATVSWTGLLSLVPAFAHEGILLVPSLEETTHALSVTSPLFTLWTLLLLGTLAWKGSSPVSFHRKLGWVYAVHFTMAAVLISTPALTEGFSRAQLFFMGHGVHSIFTLGTVLILDLLFLSSKSSALLKQHMYPLFATISAVIWIGLGVDFLSVSLVFGDAIALTPKFFFMQTVVGVLIINGVLLSGPVARKVYNSVKRRGKPLTKRWQLVGDVCGTLSVVSWLSITFVDFFANLTLGYGSLMLIYLSAAAVAFVGHLVWAYVDPGMPEAA